MLPKFSAKLKNACLRARRRSEPRPLGSARAGIFAKRIAWSALAIACCMFVSYVSRPVHAQSHPTVTHEMFDQWMTQLSNWNRWGKDDQMGAINLITPAKRKQALALVKDGASYSMARNAEMQEEVDNPAPIVRKMTRVGSGAPTAGSGGTGDTFFI